MKSWMYLMLSLSLWACKSDQLSDNYAAQEPDPVANQDNNNPVVNQNNTADAGAIVKDPASQPAAPAVKVAETKGGTITLAAEQKTVSEGEQFCMKFSVANFQGILSTQYTLRWDPAILTYLSIKNFGLPYMDEQDFGIPLTKGGKLTCVWIDDSLGGVSLSDGAVMYEVCFEANQGSSGKTSPMEFVEQPTPFESVTISETVLGISPINGLVRVN